MSEENPNDNHASYFRPEERTPEEEQEFQNNLAEMQRQKEDEEKMHEELEKEYEEGWQDAPESEFEQDYVTGEHERATIQAEEGQ